uniref:C-type lectin domain-containing protein n=1 Tax=Acrobeloides nanus TaxID=290746 RepID=A0A914D9I1_9BILA
MFNLSEQNCEQTYGGHLTSVQNAYENSFLANSATSLFGSPQSIWLGANKTSDNWFWIDRSLFKYTNWAQANFTLRKVI